MGILLRLPSSCRESNSFHKICQVIVDMFAITPIYSKTPQNGQKTARYVLSHGQTAKIALRYVRTDSRVLRDINIVFSCNVETVCLLGNHRLPKPDATVKIGIDMEDYYRIRDNAENKEKPE